MIDVHKSLSKQMMRILSRQEENMNREEFEPMKTNLRKAQVHEWIQLGEAYKAGEVLKKVSVYCNLFLID